MKRKRKYEGKLNSETPPDSACCRAGARTRSRAADDGRRVYGSAIAAQTKRVPAKKRIRRQSGAKKVTTSFLRAHARPSVIVQHVAHPSALVYDGDKRASNYHMYSRARSSWTVRNDCLVASSNNRWTSRARPATVTNNNDDSEETRARAVGLKIFRILFFFDKSLAKKKMSVEFTPRNVITCVSTINGIPSVRDSW